VLEVPKVLKVPEVLVLKVPEVLVPKVLEVPGCSAGGAGGAGSAVPLSVEA
jgi:hypothetical protein